MYKRQEVLQAALGRPLRLLALGSAAGLVLGILAARVLAYIVYSATPRDPLVLAGVVAAMALTGLTLDGWLSRTAQPIAAATQGAIPREGNPDGALFGEVLVFTGTLEIPRKTAADMASGAGCRVAVSYTHLESPL